MKPWTMPTDQELFDNAALGIRWQGFEQAISGTTCVVMAKDGKRCALGHSCTDGSPGRATSPQWDRIGKHSLLSRRLVNAHDGTLAWGKNDWINQMYLIAQDFGLDDSALYFTEKPD